MYRETECKKCEYAENLKECAVKHMSEARRLIAKGDPERADLLAS
jgi:hypothetical protein